jgi:hypothetical protein
MVTHDDSIDENNKNKMLVNRHRNKKKNVYNPNDMNDPFFLDMLCRGNCCCPPPLPSLKTLDKLPDEINNDDKEKK